MKKKIYFIVAAFIQIIFSIYSIINAKAIIENLLVAIDMLPEVMQERVNTIYQNVGNRYIIVLAIICIIVDLFIIYIASSDKLAEKKGTIIVLSIITLFTASYSIVELIAIVNVIVMVSIKGENAKRKKEIPNIEKEKVDKKKMLMACGLLVIYFSQFIWGDFISSNVLGMLIQVVFYIGMIILSILVFNDKLRGDFKLFMKNFSRYMAYILPRIGIFYIVFVIISLICVTITKSTASNQEAIENLPILLSFPLAVIYAPIVEEALFRGAFRRFISNDKLFILTSGIVFGLLHTIFAESNIVNIFVLAVPYGIMGGFLAYIYVKTNNMMSNITCHALNNFVAMIITILITKI